MIMFIIGVSIIWVSSICVSKQEMIKDWPSHSHSVTLCNDSKKRKWLSFAIRHFTDSIRKLESVKSVLSSMEPFVNYLFFFLFFFKAFFLDPSCHTPPDGPALCCTLSPKAASLHASSFVMHICPWCLLCPELLFTAESLRPNQSEFLFIHGGHCLAQLQQG